MSKYDNIERHLRQSGSAFVPMTFRQIERILGLPLPPSSRIHRAWWSNNPANNVMTKAWLKAGYRTEAVDLESEKLVFHRIAKKDRGTGPSQIDTHGEKKPRRNPLFGCLEGVITIPDDLDLTRPADPEWGDDRET